MHSRTRALSGLALGLGLGGVATEADAAPAAPPPPRSQTSSPPPPTGTPLPSPFLPTTRSTGPAGTNSTPPPPSSVPRGDPPGETTVNATPEPEAEPQDLSHTWGFSRRTPPKPRYVRTHDPSYAAPNPVGFYSGVSVSGNHVPPLPAKTLGAPPTVLTWTGFERAPEGSRVFLQLSDEAVHTVDQKGQTIKIRLRNTTVNVRNNMRRLDLRYFRTPIREVKVVRRGRDTVVTVQLKRVATPVVQIVDGKAGYKLMVVQFDDAQEADAPVSTTRPPLPPTTY
ncbi:MAG: hypothetical protein K0V04_23740 [Deltaproteobacteria bacterium]|nr:hypothetical protein [Deltaproteobacteria bacterium]